MKHNSKVDNNGYFIFGVFFTKYTIRPSEKITLIQCTYTMIFFWRDDLDLMRFFWGAGVCWGGLQNIELKDPFKGCYTTLAF
jgi:hypothetical protein